MEGNRYEFLAILSWVEQFWTNSDNGFGIDPEDESVGFALGFDLVMAVAAALRYLIASFDNSAAVLHHTRTQPPPGAGHRVLLGVRPDPRARHYYAPARKDDASRFRSLTGIHVTQDTRDAYTQWVYNRVSLLAPPVSLPSTALDWEKLANEVQSSQHLRITEESARSWYTGVVAFRQDVEGLIADAEANGGISSAEAASLSFHMGQFPLSPRL
ncbi:hypothetical protein N7501_000568 [Penicillium viridicatum]|nr:hypothetical protein N7501_000568 [Penicillium viridicatum]